VQRFILVFVFVRIVIVIVIAITEAIRSGARTSGGLGNPALVL
jgi:hypothetical protein